MQKGIDKQIVKSYTLFRKKQKTNTKGRKKKDERSGYGNVRTGLCSCC
jgi:hypothetical protein